MPSSSCDDEHDVRDEARLLDTVLAVQLVLEARELGNDPVRSLNMIDWLLDSQHEEIEPNGKVPTRLFIAAIQATKPPPKTGLAKLSESLGQGQGGKVAGV